MLFLEADQLGPCPLNPIQLPLRGCNKKLGQSDMAEWAVLGEHTAVSDRDL